MNFDEEKPVITDADIEKRLNKKMHTASRMFILIFVMLLIVALGIFFMINMFRGAVPSPAAFFEGLYLIVVTPAAIVLVIIEFKKYLKEKKAEKRSHGSFTVTEDTVTSIDEQAGEAYRGTRGTYTLTVGLTLHDDYVTHTSELVGSMTEPGEKCYVVAYTDEPRTPILVYSARIYRYVKR